MGAEQLRLTSSPSSRKREPGGREERTERMSLTEGEACGKYRGQLRKEIVVKNRRHVTQIIHQRRPLLEAVCVGDARHALGKRVALVLKKGKE